MIIIKMEFWWAKEFYDRFTGQTKGSSLFLGTMLFLVEIPQGSPVIFS